MQKKSNNFDLKFAPSSPVPTHFCTSEDKTSTIVQLIRNHNSLLGRGIQAGKKLQPPVSKFLGACAAAQNVLPIVVAIQYFFLVAVQHYVMVTGNVMIAASHIFEMGFRTTTSFTFQN